jgi:chromosome segregation ATPase
MLRPIYLLFGFCFGSSLIFTNEMYSQTDSQLRDPEFLIERYNELAAKHNALIEKTKLLVQTKQTASQSVVSSDNEVLLKNELNEALAKLAAMETQTVKLRQEGLRKVNSNQYLDETNARLRRQLQELKAEEMSLGQKNMELQLENRRLKNALENAGSVEESTLSKIRNLELSKTTAERKLSNVKKDKVQIDAENKQLSGQVERLLKENAKLNQKLAGLGIDQETSTVQLRDLKDSLRKAENEVTLLESEESVMRESLMSARQEIARLNGLLSISDDKLSILELENADESSRVGQLDAQLDVLNQQIEELQKINTELIYDAQRNEENARLVQLSNEDLRQQLEIFSNRNQELINDGFANKEEVTILRSQLGSLGLKEARVSSELDGLRRSNDQLVAKNQSLEAEKQAMLESVDLMRIEIEGIEANERNLVNKLEQIDEENQNLLSQTGNLHKDRAFYQERAAQLEAQLNQTVASERFLKQQLASLEEKMILKDAKIQELEELGSSDYQRLLAETRQLESEFSEILGREQVLLNRTAILENENLLISEKLSESKIKEQQLNRKIDYLTDDNANLQREIESSLRVRNQLRNSIIDVIDQNDRVESRTPEAIAY